MGSKNIDPELEAQPRAAAAAAGIDFLAERALIARAHAGPALRRLAEAADNYESAADLWAAGAELLAAARGIQHVVDAVVEAAAAAPAGGQDPQT